MGRHNISYGLRASDAHFFSRTIANVFVQASARERSNEALAELHQHAEEFAARLLESCVRRGARVGIFARRCAAWLLRVAAIVVVGSLCAPIASAAEEASCGELPCRANGVAYVSEEGGVVILPGEEFSVELAIADGKIAGVTPRKLQPTLKNSIELKLTVDSGGVMLAVKSHIGDLVKYDVYMKLRDGRLLYTSSCPLMGGLGAFEMWSDPIESLELRNFRLLEGRATMVCN